MTQRFIGSLIFRAVKVGVVSGCMIALIAGCSSRLQSTTASKNETPKVPVTQVEPEIVVEETAPQEVVAVKSDVAPQPIQEEGPSFVPAIDIPVEAPALPAPRPEVTTEIFAKSKTTDLSTANALVSEPAISPEPIVAPKPTGASDLQGEQVASLMPSTSDQNMIQPEEDMSSTVGESESSEIPTFPNEQISQFDDSNVEAITDLPIISEPVIKDEPMQVAKVMTQEPDEADILEIELERALSDIFFDFDQFEIREDAGVLLKANAQLLSEKFAESNIVVEGHADQRGTQSYNLVLGERRAQAIKSFLQDLGVPGEKLQIVSYGKEKPFCFDQTKTCFQENRRGHFVVK